MEDRAPPVRRRTAPLAAEARERLIAELDGVRRRICAYGPGAVTCDCKHGLVPTAGGWRPEFLGGECTGCPELRDLVRELQAEAVADAG
jgi:hypothetical protein